MSSPALYLLAMLLVATLLGVVIGFAWSRLLDRPRFNAMLSDAEQRHTVDKRQSAARVDSLEGVVARQRELAAGHKARQTAMESHMQTQRARIDSLLAEQCSTEERQIQLERRFVALRQELGMAERDRAIAFPESDDDVASTGAAATSESAEIGVPVLNRRVSLHHRERVKRHHARTAVVSSDFLEGEDDIPVLSEDDLPDTLDTNELGDLVDER